MNFKFKKIDPKFKQDIITISLILFFLVSFVFLYNNLFKSNTVVFDLEDPEIFFGKEVSSSDAAGLIIKKIRRDIKNIENELDNDFYKGLREYRTSGNLIIKPGRENPFILE